MGDLVEEELKSFDIRLSDLEKQMISISEKRKSRRKISK